MSLQPHARQQWASESLVFNARYQVLVRAIRANENREIAARDPEEREYYRAMNEGLKREIDRLRRQANLPTNGPVAYQRRVKGPSSA